jgi:hypothetical protein
MYYDVNICFTEAQTQVDDMNRTISKNIGEINETTQPFVSIFT